MRIAEKLRQIPGLEGIAALVTLRNALIAVGVVLITAVGLRLAGALFIPPGSIQQQMETTIHDWTGYRVVVNGGSKRSFWPSPYVSVDDVSIFPADPTDTTPIVTVKRMTGSFGIISAMQGEPEFSRVVLDAPVFNVLRHSDSTFNLQPGGKLADLATTGNLATLAMLAGSGLGHFDIKDGTLHYRQEGSNDIEMTAINGSLDWPSFIRSLSFRLTGDLWGKPIEASGSSNQPGYLVSGKNGQLSLNLKSPALEASFDGKANLGVHPYIAGDFDTEITDAQAAGDWLGLKFKAIRVVNSLSAKAKLASEGMKFTLSDLTLGLDDTHATGVLEGGWMNKGSTPYLSGTLAFDKFDIATFLSAFSAVPNSAHKMPTRIDPAFLSQFQLDLRLSAVKASLAAATFSDVAASARIKDGFASFAVASSQFAKGQLSGELTVTSQAGEPTSSNLHMQFRDIGLSALQNVFSIKGPWPDAAGSGTLDLSAKLPQSTFDNLDVEGILDLQSGPGKLTGFDQDAFRNLAVKKRFFDLAEAGKGTLAFDSLKLTARIENGVAELSQSDFSGPASELRLDGVIPYKNNSVALTGVLSSPQNTQVPDVRFFAGGAWPNIVISPVSAMTSPQ
jgi:AsmA protein